MPYHILINSYRMCFLPLWTPKVKPTNSGRIVDLLDHVLSHHSARIFTFSAFFIKYISTKVLSILILSYKLLLFLPTFSIYLSVLLLFLVFLPFAENPLQLDYQEVLPSTPWMVNRVHSNTSNNWPYTNHLFPTLPFYFSYLD